MPLFKQNYIKSDQIYSFLLKKKVLIGFNSILNSKVSMIILEKFLRIKNYNLLIEYFVLK